jgi:hypothetical protein
MVPFERWFLDPDGVDFNAHFALWDVNCIFCTQRESAAGLRRSERSVRRSRRRARHRLRSVSRPADLHIAPNANPLRRYWLYLTSAHGPMDPTIRSPHELTPERQIQLCGHCHGQRTPNPPERIAQFLTTGDPYTAGEDLASVTKPIDVHTTMRASICRCASGRTARRDSPRTSIKACSCHAATRTRSSRASRVTTCTAVTRRA